MDVDPECLRPGGDKGKAIILVTKGALVRQMEKEIRESLTEADWLEAVITMPANMYASTHLGFELLVFNKWKPSEYRGKVFMADTSNMKYGGSVCNEISRETVRELQRAYADFKEHDLFSAVVSLEEIRKKEFSWNPFLYLRFRKEEENRKTVELGEIAEIMRGAQITKEEEKLYSERPTHYWLNIRNIGEGDISFEESSMIRAKSPDWERKFGIQEDDIIMTSKGSVLKMCIVTPDMPKAFLCGNLTRIRVDQTKYSPYALYEFLNSEEGRNALDSIQSGTTIKVFNNTNLSRLPVPDYKNPEELQQQFKQIYQEYRTSVKEAECKNRELVEQLVEFLRSGMGIESSKIFCTSLNGALPTGRDFVQIIRQEVKEREMVMALITPEYLKSQFCMMELGAA